MGRKGNSGRVRIIGGRWRGRRVDFPATAGLRPTTGRVRETVFNWLAPFLAGARVLDLYAGSGVLGFEALSRGAASVTAVDSNPRVAGALRSTARVLEASGYTAVTMDVRRFLERPAGGPFELVFLDPPHASTDYGRLCALLDSSNLLAAGALVYVELATPGSPDFAAPDAWCLHRAGCAGHLSYQLWRRAD